MLPWDGTQRTGHLAVIALSCSLPGSVATASSRITAFFSTHTLILSCVLMLIHSKHSHTQQHSRVAYRDLLLVPPTATFRKDHLKFQNSSLQVLIITFRTALIIGCISMVFGTYFSPDLQIQIQFYFHQWE